MKGFDRSCFAFLLGSQLRLKPRWGEGQTFTVEPLLQAGLGKAYGQVCRGSMAVHSQYTSQLTPGARLFFMVLDRKSVV